jgi:hypothetical protein
MAVKYINVVHCKTLEYLPKLGFFCFENIPSGNPGPNFRPNKINPLENSAGSADILSNFLVRSFVTKYIRSKTEQSSAEKA